MSYIILVCVTHEYNQLIPMILMNRLIFSSVNVTFKQCRAVCLPNDLQGEENISEISEARVNWTFEMEIDV